MRPKGTQAELEKRRLHVIELLDYGNPPRKVASLLGVSLRSVRRWCALVRSVGPSALKLKPTLGRPRKLRMGAELELKETLLQGAQASGFSADLWTSARIAQLIAERFGVHYHVDHVGRILRTLGWSMQELNGRVQRCKETDWPEACLTGHPKRN